MNWKILGPFIVAVVFFLVFPILPALLQMASIASAPDVVADPNAPKPGSLPPLLNEGNLPGTMWEVEPKKGVKIQVTLNAGGQALAHTDNKLVQQFAGTDTLPGTWSVNGAKLSVATTFKDKEYKTDLDIIGDKVYKDGIEIKRLQ